MNENVFKEVYFYKFCQTCVYKDKPETEDPCWDCLGTPLNVYSHKPVFWKGKDKK